MLSLFLFHYRYVTFILEMDLLTVYPCIWGLSQLSLFYLLMYPINNISILKFIVFWFPQLVVPFPFYASPYLELFYPSSIPAYKKFQEFFKSQILYFEMKHSLISSKLEGICHREVSLLCMYCGNLSIYRDFLKFFSFL